MEPIENLFSSPGKSDHEDQQDEGSDDYGSGEEAMDITTSAAQQDAQRKSLVANFGYSIWNWPSSAAQRSRE
jgi:hypothetical protein